VQRRLEELRAGQRTLGRLLAELRESAARVNSAVQTAAQGQPAALSPDEPARAPASEESLPAPVAGTHEAQNGEMVDALAAAVERLRARVAEVPAPGASEQGAAELRAPRHKHSMSLIGRWRLRRKQRRAR
jgi:hypothetical protein